jgi:hypothetical protein
VRHLATLPVAKNTPSAQTALGTHKAPHHVAPSLTSDQYTDTTRPAIVPFDNFTLQEVFYAYKNPSEVDQNATDWIEWVYRLRQDDRRHALEFVEGWSGFRIALLGSVPWVAATVVGVTWVVKAGDRQTAFTVAAFILTVGTCKMKLHASLKHVLSRLALLALLAIVSKIES